MKTKAEELKISAGIEPAKEEKKDDKKAKKDK